MWVLRFGPNGTTPNLCYARRTIEEAVAVIRAEKSRHTIGAHSCDHYIVTRRDPVIAQRRVSTGGYTTNWDPTAWMSPEHVIVRGDDILPSPPEAWAMAQANTRSLSPDARRVADWLRECMPGIDVGDDPVGLLMAMCANLRDRLVDRSNSDAPV